MNKSKKGEIVIAERPGPGGRFHLERVEATDKKGKITMLRAYPEGEEREPEPWPYKVFLLNNLPDDQQLLVTAWGQKTVGTKGYSSRSDAKNAVCDILGISREDAFLQPLPPPKPKQEV